MAGLLIYGAITDAHIRLVAHSLEKEGIRSFIYDPWGNVRTACRYRTGEISRPVIWGREIVWKNDEPKFPVRRIELGKDVKAIWFRNKRFVDTIETYEDQVRLFSTRENGAFIFGVITTFNLIHFNDIISTHLQRFKLLQLATAEKAGFLVPETLISSDKRTISGFVKKGADDHQASAYEFRSTGDGWLGLHDRSDDEPRVPSGNSRHAGQKPCGSTIHIPA